MPQYVRKEGLRAIHLVQPDGTLRCRRDIDASRYETIEPGERDWQNVCLVCMKTPSDPEKYYEGKPERRAQADVLYQTSLPTRKLDKKPPRDRRTAKEAAE